MCVSVCFARNNDEMFERDSNWSDTDKIFKERDHRDHLSLLIVYYVLALHFQRERDQEHFGCALSSSISVFPDYSPAARRKYRPHATAPVLSSAHE
jgi:hypothetical protein